MAAGDSSLPIMLSSDVCSTTLDYCTLLQALTKRLGKAGMREADHESGGARPSGFLKPGRSCVSVISWELLK